MVKKDQVTETKKSDNIVKRTKKKWTVEIQFLSFGEVQGINYSYKSFIPLKKGDYVVVQALSSYGLGQVVSVSAGFGDKKATKFVVQKVDTEYGERLLSQYEEMKSLESAIRIRVEEAKEEAVIRALAKEDPELAELYESYKQFKE